MNNRPDIWLQLQDHEITPPSELFDRLLHAIHASPSLEGDRQPGDPFNGVGSLQRLQQHITSPPSSMLSAIRKSTVGTGRFGGFPPFRFFYGAVAACLLVLAGLLFFVTALSHHPRVKDVSRNRATPASVRPAQEQQSLPPAIAADSSDTAIAVTANATDSTGTALTIRTNRPPEINIDHHSFPLVDNDLLITFTSFKYPEMADHVGKIEDKDMKVRLDQYTNIVISKQIVAMIKEMYQTRSNGKPTRRARKMKDRLEDWKRADEKHFDSTAFYNAADPIDLADFIFK